MKTRVNLYLPRLRPVKEVLPFSQSVTIIIITIICVLVSTLGLTYINSSLKSNNMALKDTLRAKESMLTKKATHLSKLTMNTPLIKKIELIKLKISEKKKVLATLDKEIKIDSGFSHLFTGLATLNMHNVWLTDISTRNGQLNFGGRALNSSDIPRWVNELESSEVLNGLKFSNLSIERKDDIVHFTLHNDPNFVVEGIQ